MATWDEVRRIATALPEVTERDGRHEWRVRDKAFVFERPLRRADQDELGDAAPDGPILGVWVSGLSPTAAPSLDPAPRQTRAPNAVWFG